MSSVTLSELDPEGEQRSVLVVVPDNQLSLAIGKKGQNARLAAKLTGLRVDIKSEGEIEEERRRDEEERAEGAAALAALPVLEPAAAGALAAAGLYSPARIVRAGPEAVASAAGVDEGRAAAIVAAAEIWIAEHPVAAIPDESAGEESDGSVAEPAWDAGMPAPDTAADAERRQA